MGKKKNDTQRLWDGVYSAWGKVRKRGKKTPYSYCEGLALTCGLTDVYKLISR